LRTAAGLAPENPRVKLVQAICASAKDPDPAATDRWRAVVASFEAAPPSRPGKPDWGHVEALTMLGETYLQRGDPVAARDALERALVLAPDYRQAQQLLQTAAARPR
jgi:Tfp pilus assembly protein PilF